MTHPKPIRFDFDTWLVLRNDEIHPKAIIERRRDGRGEDVFFMSRWALDAGTRVLMGAKGSLVDADDSERSDLPTKRGGGDGPPNGIDGDGVQRRRLHQPSETSDDEARRGITVSCFL